MKWKKKTDLLKMESTYGVDSAPTGVANAILASNVNLTPLAAETIERENTRPELGAYEQIHVGEHVMLEFDVELAGAGSAGGIPAYGPVMRSCGFAQNNTPSVDTQYALVSQNEEASTIYIPFDGQLHKMVGCRGAWSLTLGKKGIPMRHFSFKGLWVNPASVADPAIDWSAFQKPLHVSNANTPTFSLHGQNLNLSSLEINSNIEVIHRDLVGLEEIAITDRQVKAKIKFEAPVLSSFNVFTVAKSNALGVMQIVHGTVAGNIVQVDAPKVQIINPTYSEEDKQTMIEADLIFVPNTGDDEYLETIK